jgi:hypothetical protein
MSRSDGACAEVLFFDGGPDAQRIVTVQLARPPLQSVRLRGSTLKARHGRRRRHRRSSTCSACSRSGSGRPSITASQHPPPARPRTCAGVDGGRAEQPAPAADCARRGQAHAAGGRPPLHVASRRGRSRAHSEPRNSRRPPPALPTCLLAGWKGGRKGAEAALRTWGLAGGRQGVAAAARPGLSVPCVPWSHRAHTMRAIRQRQPRRPPGRRALLSFRRCCTPRSCSC